MPKPNVVSLSDRFAQKWAKMAGGDCWVWHGAMTVAGYGKIFIEGKLEPAHRIGYEIHVGPIPEGMVLDHLCRRKECVNPAHLEAVTVAENTRRRNYEQRLDPVQSLRPKRHTPTLRERFFAKVDKNGPNGCWNWTSNKNPLGYGSISVKSRPQQAHRVSYEMVKGKIPDGLVIDHLCRNPSCVNPDHLEAITPKENTRRGISGQRAREYQLAKIFCLRGHPLSGDNLLKSKKQRICRLCSIARKRGYRALLPRKGQNLSGLALGAKASSIARKSRTHCKRGHLFDEQNTSYQGNGRWRYCRACDNFRAIAERIKTSNTGD